MKITAQEEYGLRCLLRFARAPAQQTLTIVEIAEAEKLSVPYTAKLLSILRHAGLVESVRGRNGGYALVGAPSEIGLGSVLWALGESLFENPEYCERYAGTESNEGCVHQNNCSLRGLWKSLDHWMRVALDRIALADLLEHENRIPEMFRSRLASALAEL
jgi:Rrf2 family protein